MAFREEANKGLVDLEKSFILQKYQQKCEQF